MGTDIETIEQRTENRRKIKGTAALNINKIKLEIIETLK